jgi:5-methylcytosine-specific restriction endonuclease McrA
MNRIPAKSSRLRLAPKLYENLRQQVFRRDGWRCQSCGVMSNLEVHHRQFCSHSGADAEENLTTLCTACHSIVHRGDQAQLLSGYSVSWAR